MIARRGCYDLGASFIRRIKGEPELSKELHEGNDWGQYGHYADYVDVTQHETHSRLLGPDGKRLPYERPKVGFDLSSRDGIKNRT